MNNDVKDLLKPKEIAEAMELTDGRIYQLLGAGELKGFKFGGRWRIRREDLLSYIQKANKERVNY